MLIVEFTATVSSAIPVIWVASSLGTSQQQAPWYAFCINQDDLQEKSSQIPLMGKVYSSAETTFCCLDYSAPASQISLTFTIFKAMVEGVENSDYNVHRWDNQPETVNLDWLVNNPVILEDCTGTEVWCEVDIPANIAMDAFKKLTY